MRCSASRVRPGALALADGTVYRGRAFGASAVASGEVVFNTSITGYQEIATDPSYAGQIVAMTYTQIGNVGVNAADDEARRPFLSGFIVKELFDEPSNYRAEGSFEAKLAAAGVPGLAGIDTRALVRRLRDFGAQVGVLSTDPAVQDCGRARAAGAQAPSLEGVDWVARVTCDKSYRFTEGAWPGVDGSAAASGTAEAEAPHRGLRLRHQEEHPAIAGRAGLRRHGRPRDDTGGGRAGARARRHLPVEWPGRSGGGRAVSGRSSASSSSRSPSSASASATRSWASPWAARRRSSSSVTTAATSRARTSRPVASRSAPRTTAMRSSPRASAPPASPSRSPTSI